jgi:CheY-like chemotaxis protein
MQNKTALIVDDSRTASQVLRLMLEREEFQVDVIDNPEQALGYLQDHHPGVIFMDHLMPGMEGFNAVKEIKNNSLAARIPIVMYTAKSGDLYVGQAQALGAVDILPKPPTRELLRAVFRRIDQRSGAANDSVAVPAEMSAPAAEPPVAAEGFLSATRSEMAEEPETPRVAERALASVSQPSSFAEANRRDDERAGRSWLLTAVLVVAAAVLGFFAGNMQVGTAGDARKPYADTLSWALSQTLQYPYGEAPFGGDRAEFVRGLVERLQAAGFTGKLKLEGHSGQYCLVASSAGWRVADATASIDSCEVKGFFSKQDARIASSRQTPEFRALLASPAIAASGIRVEVLGDEGRNAPYPAPEKETSAGQWNAVAARNNRISVSLIPDA